ncbi:MAG: two-component system, chemotaxis family, protein-glutamate methylesterase/glutaminase [Gaiellaceae bacterium]|jgi:two-component system chemotaxis response regulator CheB|nr:two-component system, chemotaxis family, protein-glutamate methylesterase/glutaminase [Gaiellaceae bacterium]
MELLVVGASWGGLHAVSSLLRQLPDDLDVPVVIAQHRSPDPRADVLLELLAGHTERRLSEPDDKEPLRPRTIYLAASDYHLLVERGSLALSLEGRIQYSRPSIDVLFESAADAYGPELVAIILTGANSDGAAGAAAVARAGGTVVVEDPASAERPEMPRAALAAVPDALVRPLEALGATLAELARGRSLA